MNDTSSAALSERLNESKAKAPFDPEEVPRTASPSLSRTVAPTTGLPEASATLPEILRGGETCAPRRGVRITLFRSTFTKTSGIHFNTIRSMGHDSASTETTRVRSMSALLYAKEYCPCASICRSSSATVTFFRWIVTGGLAAETPPTDTNRKMNKDMIFTDSRRLYGALPSDCPKNFIILQRFKIHHS